MKRRRPVLELHTNLFSKESKIEMNNHMVINREIQQPLVSYGEDSDNESNTSNSNTKNNVQNSIVSNNKPGTAWQVCIDDNTGYTYYWNIETNQVTWEIPPEYLAYEAALQQYYAIHPSKVEQNGNHSSTLLKDNSNSNVTAASIDSKFNKNGKDLFPAYGPLLEEDINFEENEAKKMAYAKKRLLSYKSDKLKNKTDDSSHNIDKELISSSHLPFLSNSVKCTNSVSLSISQKIESKIPFIPTPDEIKEHPIFLNSLAVNANSALEGTVSSVDNAIPLNNSSKNFVGENQKPLKSGQVNNAINLRLINENYSDSDEDKDDENEDLDHVIITRLRKKALLLKELGGVVPKEIVSVLDQSKTAKDIIAEIEKEIPPDLSNEHQILNNLDTQNKFNKSEVKPLFPIVDYLKKSETQELKSCSQNSPLNQKAKMKNIQKIKLSSRAKELIKTSILTAKARATDFVETEDGLKPVEEVQKMNDSKMQNNVINTDNKNCSLEDKNQSLNKDLELFKSEINELCSLNTNDKDVNEVAEMDVEKVASDNESTALKETDDCVESNKCSPLDQHEPESADEKLIKSNNIKSENINQTKEDMYSFQTSFVILNPKRPKVLEEIETNQNYENIKNSVSLVTKCEEFLESVKKSSIDVSSPDITKKNKMQQKEDENKCPITKDSSNKTNFNDIDIDEVLNTKSKNVEKNISDLSQLIMEKLKFLSDGKGSVAPVQVMAIQIETLVGAWQTGALTLKYLSDWLDASAVHLSNIEMAAAPEGWQCEWDRSYGRYYYRNKATGTIQWDFPETNTESVRKNSGSILHDMVTEYPKTPPPPVISNDITPPPPPIISIQESRKRKINPILMNVDIETKRKVKVEENSDNSFSESSPVTPLPPLPALPPKPPTPPPPPPTSPPPPPPPPVITTSEQSVTNETSQNTKKSNESKLTTDSVGIHDALDSFYSDIASIEANFSQSNTDASLDEVLSPTVEEQPEKTDTAEKFIPKVEEKIIKKKKKVKLDSSLSLKKKGLQGLVAKWQKVSSDIK